VRTDQTVWTISNVRLAQVLPLVIASATIGFASPALAAGTTAGTTISNTAQATYDDPAGTPRTVPSNTVDITVDEVLDVTVASADAGDVVVFAGTTNQVLTFNVTNTGNGSEAFLLTPTSALGGDQFDPTTTALYLDTDGDGVYSPGTDTAYVAGSNDPVLAPDAAITVFVLSTIPAGQADLSRAFVDLKAEAVTGTGAPGTSFANAGQGGGDAVVGTSGADDVDRGAYIVQSAAVTFVKSAVVLDPFGGAKSIPGSVITYTLVANISGSGTLANLALGDTIPTDTVYEAGTITLQGVPLSDAVDSDEGELASNRVTVRLGNLTGSQTRTVTFKVKIKQ
jgi:uncharacterized repeat protein (TIGR01451 family)